MKRKIVVLVTLGALLAGCAVSPQQFAEQRLTLRPDEICQGRLAAVRNSNWQFVSDIDSELQRRGIAISSCPAIIEESSRRAAGAALVVLGAMAVASAVNSGSSSGGYGYQPGYLIDYDWAWDQFYNEHYQLVWACRGRQTGQFAIMTRCQYKSQNDFTWPSKSADLR